MRLTVYPLTPDAPEIVPAPRARKWMHTNANINRCLPATIANQSGWWVLNPAPFRATCDPETGVVEVEYDKGWKEPLFPAKNHFGGGMLTIDLPFLWETEPGWNLHVRGPANYPLLGAYCMEGILESDWARIPVPSNWQLEPGRPVIFPKDFPLAQVVPVQRGALEAFEPEIKYSDEARQDAAKYFQSREADYCTTEPTNKLDGYFKGENPDKERFEDHQVNVELKEFVHGAS